MQSNDAQEGMAEEAFLVMKLLMECGLSRPNTLMEGWRVICTLVQIQQPDPLEQVREARRHFRHAVDLLKDNQVSPRPRGKSVRTGGYLVPDEFEPWDE